MSAARREPREDGFSLVEALVALFVFGLASVGLMQLQTQSLRLFQQAESRTLAAIVAQNTLVEALAGRTVPGVGQSQGEALMAGRTWQWTLLVEPTQDPTALQLRVKVTAPGSEAVVADVLAFTPAPRIGA